MVANVMDPSALYLYFKLCPGIQYHLFKNTIKLKKKFRDENRWDNLLSCLQLDISQGETKRKYERKENVNRMNYNSVFKKHASYPL